MLRDFVRMLTLITLVSYKHIHRVKEVTIRASKQENHRKGRDKLFEFTHGIIYIEKSNRKVHRTS